MCQAENRLSETALLRWQHRAPRNYTQVFTHLDGPKALIRICRTPNCTFNLPKKSSWLPPQTYSALGWSQSQSQITKSFISRRNFACKHRYRPSSFILDSVRDALSCCPVIVCLQWKVFLICHLATPRCNTPHVWTNLRLEDPYADLWLS